MLLYVIVSIIETAMYAPVILDLPSIIVIF